MEADRAMWAREVRRIENKIKHARTQMAMYAGKIPALEAQQQDLLKKISDDYDEEHGR